MRLTIEQYLNLGYKIAILVFFGVIAFSSKGDSFTKEDLKEILEYKESKRVIESNAIEMQILDKRIDKILEDVKDNTIINSDRAYRDSIRTGLNPL